MDLTRRQLIGATALACTGCGGGGGDMSGTAPAAAIGSAGVAAMAIYRVTLRSHWDAATFPTRFPSNAHLTGLVGATHVATASFWALDRAATLGVKNVAERGSKPALLDEVALAIAAGTAGTALSGDGVPAGATEVALEFSLSQAFSRVTLLSMLGPSPDWFIGVNALPLFQDGAWRTSVQADLRVYDAGTDDGASFNAADAVSTPPRTVQLLSTGPDDSDFLNGVHRGGGTYVASMVFTLLR
jgi:hypothetical protein